MEIDNPPLDSDYDIFPFKDDMGKPSPDQPGRFQLLILRLCQRILGFLHHGHYKSKCR